jgi:hypothetical protein
MVVVSDNLLTSGVQKLVNRYVGINGRAIMVRQPGSDKESIRLYKEMLRADTVSRFCVELIYLYALSVMGEYSHPRARVEKDIRGAISNCKGSWREVIKRMLSCAWFGYSWSEVQVAKTSKNRITLANIRTLDPSLYDFEGKDGELDTVIYRGERLDYNTGVHLVVGADLSFDYCYGCGRAEPAYPFWELHQLMMPVLAIAGQRQATPLLVKKTETGDDVVLIDQVTGRPVLDEQGQQILVSKGWDAIQQLEALGSAGVTAIDPDDELFQIEPKLLEQFLFELIKLCEQYRMMAFLVPATIGSFSQSGLGDAGLANTHKEIFEGMTAGLMQDISEALIEQLIRPIVIYNFGDIVDYGSFPLNLKDEQALEVVSIVSDAMSWGAFSKNDLAVANVLRKKIGLPELTDIEFRALREEDIAIAIENGESEKRRKRG